MIKAMGIGLVAIFILIFLTKALISFSRLVTDTPENANILVIIVLLGPVLSWAVGNLILIIKNEH